MSTLKNKYNEMYHLCRHYVYECIKIYQEMNKNYCYIQGEKNKNTCDQITTFFNTYDGFLPNEPKISKVITPLTFTEKNT